MHIERVERLDPQVFLARYMLPNRPVIVVDAMATWAAPARWTPQYLSQTLGDLEVQVYDSLFGLVNVSTLAEYLEANFDRPAAHPSSEYVRWYSRLKDVDFCWADEAFAALQPDWQTPYFLPEDGYVIPGAGSRVSAQSSLFPYRGLFISGRGACTRLHRDPWTTAAVLCQFHGEKELVMYEPSQAAHLMKGREFADIRRPDPRAFPCMHLTRPSYEDVLRPGEVLFIPSQWLHHVNSLTDSISVTWNFVHASGQQRLLDHLHQDPADPELDVLRFFMGTRVPPRAAAQEIARALCATELPASMTR
jgi:hypothetical protein